MYDLNGYNSVDGLVNQFQLDIHYIPSMTMSRAGGRQSDRKWGRGKRGTEEKIPEREWK